MGLGLRPTELPLRPIELPPPPLPRPPLPPASATAAFASKVEAALQKRHDANVHLAIKKLDAARYALAVAKLAVAKEKLLEVLDGTPLKQLRMMGRDVWLQGGPSRIWRARASGWCMGAGLRPSPAAGPLPPPPPKPAAPTTPWCRPQRPQGQRQWSRQRSKKEPRPRRCCCWHQLHQRAHDTEATPFDNMAHACGLAER